MWKLNYFSVKSRETTYLTGIENTNYSEVEFSLTLTRKPLYHIFYLIIPSALIGMVGVFSFLLPYESGEKLNLPVTMFLTTMIFMLSVSAATPQTSEKIPLISMQKIIY